MQQPFQSFFKVLHPSIEDFTCILHTCRKAKNLVHTLHIHAYLCGHGLEVHTLLGNYLVSLFVEIGSMHYAQQVFDKLLHHDESSWDSLITYYTKHEEWQTALALYEKMQEDVSLHPCIFVALCRACTALKDTETGCRIHSDIARRGLLEGDGFLGSTLIDMYSKCGSLGKAQEVFDTSQVRTTVLWNTLITAYVEHGWNEEAMHCFEQMQNNDILSDAITLVCALKACGSIGAITEGYSMHADIARRDLLDENVYVASALVGMYAKCGFLAEAREVFGKLPLRNEVAWITIIAGHLEHGCSQEALSYYKQMEDEGIPPLPAIYVCSLKACGCCGAIIDGQELHTVITKKGLEGDMLIGNTLLDMYSKCGFLAEAHNTFDKLTVQTLVSWTALIAGFVEFGHGEDALKCLEQMQRNNITPDAATLVCSLKACSSLKVIVEGRKLHADIIKKGLMEADSFIVVTLVHMYSNCGVLGEAQKSFNGLTEKTAVSRNALVAGYVEHGYGMEALNCFEEMEQEGILPDIATLAYCLIACGSTQKNFKAREFHSQIVKRGIEGDLLLGNTLVDMYAGFGLLMEAQRVFDKLPMQTASSWTSLIAGFVEHGCSEETLNCFSQAQSKGIACNAVIFVCSLKACSITAATELGKEIHAQIVKLAVFEEDARVVSALVALYVKYGWLKEANAVLEKLPVRDLVSWTALIRGYIDYGHHEEALFCFKQMCREGISPDFVAFVSGLSACSSIGATVMGLRMHAEINKRGLETELLIGNCLVDMYAKCGSIMTARMVFDTILARDVVSWNVLITGYAQLGESEHVFQLLDIMVNESKMPDMYTFFSVLNVCSHAGLTDKGQLYFRALIEKYDLSPTFEHFTCMVDLLSRAGLIEDAVMFIMQMPCHPGLVMWHIVLGACRMLGYLEFGTHTFEHAVELNEKDITTYVSMSNLYVDAEVQE